MTHMSAKSWNKLTLQQKFNAYSLVYSTPRQGASWLYRRGVFGNSTVYQLEFFMCVHWSLLFWLAAKLKKDPKFWVPPRVPSYTQLAKTRAKEWAPKIPKGTLGRLTKAQKYHLSGEIFCEIAPDGSHHG
jgi:hypothetical protein